MSTIVTIQVFADVEVFEDGTITMRIDPKELDTDFVVESIYEDKDDDEQDRIAAAITQIETARSRWSGSPITVRFA